MKAFFRFIRRQRKLVFIVSLCFIVIFGSVAVLLALKPKGTDAAWFNDAYAYRQLFSFTHNADVSSPRAVTFSLDTAELITAGVMQSDCDDTRFTDISGTPLQYELTGTCNNAATTYEVVFPTVVNGTNSAYVYYGNAAAATGSRSVTGITALTPSGGDPSLTDRTVEEKGQSPVSYWNFDEGYGTTTQDSSTNNNDATISGASWRSEDMCVSGKCLRFDGSDDVATVTNASSIDLNEGLASAFTFSAWIKANSDGENDTGQIFQKGTSTYLRVDSQSGSSLDLEASLDLATSDATVNISGGITANTWHYVTLVYTDDGDDEIDVYIDGKLKGTSTNGSGAPAAESSNFLIGGTTTANFHGFIDEPKLYNYARSESQISGGFNARGTNEGVSTSLGGENQKALSDGLVGYWKMDESDWTQDCSTDSALDSSGNAVSLDSCPSTTGPDPASGKFGNAGNFDGSDDYLKSSSNYTGVAGAATMTVAAWVNITNSSEGYIVHTGNFDMRARLSGTTDMACSFNTSAGFTVLRPTVDLTSGVWAHIACVYDGTNISAYKDGVFISSTTTTGSIVGSGAVGIGASNAGATITTGKIDDVRIYNRSLSASEVAQIYNWTPGPLGEWKLNETTGTNAPDTSGNGYAATLNANFNNNSDSGWTFGKYGNALHFDGSNDVTQVATSDFGLVGETDFTLSAWVKLDVLQTTTNSRVLTYQIGSGGTDGYHLAIIGSSNGTCPSRFLFEVEKSNTNYASGCSSSNTAAVTNTWYHITGVFEDSTNTATLYVNGVKQITGSTFGLGLGVANTLTFASQSTAGTNLLDGSIDHTRLYNYALSSKQVVTDMNAGHPIVGTPIASAVGHWKFDEGSGTTAQDQTPNDNDLTLSAAGWTTSGKYDKAYDGATNRRLTRDDENDFDFANGSDNFSISVWFNRGGTISNQEYLVDKHNSNDGYTIYMDSDGDIVCGIGDGAASFPEETIGGSLSKNYDDTNWHHAVCVKQGTASLRLYVDGKEIASDTSLAVDADMSNSGKLIIGDTNETDGTDEWLGDIDELKIYRAALSADDVEVEYNQAKSQVFGALSTESDGITASNSSARGYCVPGDTNTCNAPAGEWKFDEASGTSATDTSGNGKTGTLANGPIRVPGKFNTALSFDGSNDVVTFSSITPSNSTYTVSAWIYPKSTSTAAWGGILTDTLGGDGIFYKGSGAGADAGKISAYDPNGDNLSTGTLTLNTWNHIEVVNNASAVTFYINGKNAGTATLNHNPAFASIGSTTSPDPFGGLIDDIKLYTYARTPAQVAWDYNRGGPIAHWRFDECQGTTATDATGNGFNGTITPGASGNTAAGTCTSGNSAHMWADGATGKYNASLGFDGTDDYVSVADNNTLDITGDLSIEAWVKFNTLNGNNRSILEKGNGSTNAGRSYLLRVNTSNQLNAFIFCCSGSTPVASGITDTTTTLATGQWYHVVYTRNSNTVRLFVNGKKTTEQTDTFTSSDLITTTSDILAIGKAGSASSAFFDGQIDEVKLYNYSLTPKQVEVSHNQGAVRFGPTTGQP